MVHPISKAEVVLTLHASRMAIPDESRVLLIHLGIVGWVTRTSYDREYSNCPALKQRGLHINQPPATGADSPLQRALAFQL